ncbi:MAG: DUF58 domain-containing protein [Planctomycetota bacterium]
MARPRLWTRLQLLAVRIPRPTLAGWTALAVSLVGAWMAAENGENLALIAAALALGLTLAGIALPALLARDLRVTRNLPRRAMAGADLPVTVRVEGAGRRGGVPPCTVTDIPPRGAGGGGQARVPGSRRGSPTAEGVYRARFRRRGLHQLGVYVLETAAPFGFARALVAGRQPEEILVLPRIRPIELPRLPEPRVPVRRRSWGRPARDHQMEDFAGMREWRPGENPRRIHWRTSARRGILVMREYESPADRRVTVALETRLAEGDRNREAARFERAVTLAASLCAALERRGSAYRLALGGAGNGGCTPFGHGRAHLDRLLVRLAMVQPDPAATAEAMHEEMELGLPGDAAVLWVRTGAGEAPDAPGGVATLRPGADSDREAPEAVA